MGGGSGVDRDGGLRGAHECGVRNRRYLNLQL